MCAPSEVELKLDYLASLFGIQCSKSLEGYYEEVRNILHHAKKNLGFDKSRMMKLQRFCDASKVLAAATFGDWKWETKNQALLFDGLPSITKETMPVSFGSVEQSNSWGEDIVSFLLGFKTIQELKEKLSSEEEKKEDHAL